MAKKKTQQQEPRELTGLEKLGLRVSAMINSPKAQLERQARIHRLDTDTDEAWGAVMDLLAEEDGLEMEQRDGELTLRWYLPNDSDTIVALEEFESLEEDAAPF